MGRDTSILHHILMYCNLIEKSIERFGDSLEVFISDIDYHNSVCMSLLQIGELVGRLSDGFKEKTNHEIPWKQIRALRNTVAHDYSNVTDSDIFETAHGNVRELKKFCEAHILADRDNDE